MRKTGKIVCFICEISMCSFILHNCMSLLVHNAKMTENVQQLISFSCIKTGLLLFFARLMVILLSFPDMWIVNIVWMPRNYHLSLVKSIMLFTFLETWDIFLMLFWEIFWEMFSQKAELEKQRSCSMESHMLKDHCPPFHALRCLEDAHLGGYNCLCTYVRLCLFYAGLPQH